MSNSLRNSDQQIEQMACQNVSIAAVTLITAYISVNARYGFKRNGMRACRYARGVTQYRDILLERSTNIPILKSLFVEMIEKTGVCLSCFGRRVKSNPAQKRLNTSPVEFLPKYKWR